MGAPGVPARGQPGGTVRHQTGGCGLPEQCLVQYLQPVTQYGLYYIAIYILSWILYLNNGQFLIQNVVMYLPIL